MKRYAIFFCHVPTKFCCPDVAQEFLRQYNYLYQFANQNDLPVEYCFFHEGSLDVNNPDDVLSHFLCCVQTNTLGLILIERIEHIPANQRDCFPPIQMYSVCDNILISVGRSNNLSQKPYHLPLKLFGYCRLACASQFMEG